MNPSKDIIGIVKELRQMAKNATEGDWRIETNAHGLKQDIMAPGGLIGEYWSETDAAFICSSRKHIPAIAEALLIAMDALENIKNAETVEQLKDESEDEYGLDPEEAIEMAHENIVAVAHTALSRIRSLPSS